MRRNEWITFVLSAALIGAISIAPAPVRAVAGEDFYISDQPAAGAGIGAGVSCSEPDVRYTGAAGGMLNDVLGDIYADSDFDSGDTIIICAIDGVYSMDGDVVFDDGNFDDDNNVLTANAATLDLSDIAAPGSVTITTDSDDAGDVVIDANDFAPFDFTDATISISNLTIDEAGDNSDGAGIHVLQDQSTDGVSLNLSNVVIKNSSANGSGAAASVDGSITVSDSLFDTNRSLVGSGGAIYARGEVTISDSTFVNNLANSSGGAIQVTGATEVSIVDSVFGAAEDPEVGNQAAEGGDLWISSDIEAVASVAVTNSRFYHGAATDGPGGSAYIECSATEYSGVLVEGATASLGDGGALYLTDDGGCAFDEDYSVTIVGSTFDSNFSEDQGGAVASAQNSKTNFAALLISNSRFVDNRAEDWGGAVNVDHRALTITGSTFIRNGGRGGGAIETCNGDEDDDEDIHISNSKFIGNESRDEGAQGWGGAIVFNCIMEHPDLIVKDNTFQGNHADYMGGAIWVDDWDFNESVAFTGNRFLGNVAKGGGAYGVFVPQGTKDTVLLKAFTKNSFRTNAVSDGGFGGRIAALFYDQLAEASRYRFAEAAVLKGNRLQGSAKRGLVYQGELPAEDD